RRLTCHLTPFIPPIHPSSFLLHPSLSRRLQRLHHRLQNPRCLRLLPVLGVRPADQPVPAHGQDVPHDVLGNRVVPPLQHRRSPRCVRQRQRAPRREPHLQVRLRPRRVCQLHDVLRQRR